MTPIEEYIQSCPEGHQAQLFELRDMILKAGPSLKEKISWGMPTFFLSKPVIHFALHKAHIGLYPGPQAVTRFKEELSGFKTSKGAVQLPLDRPLPQKLIMDITRWSIENPDGK